MYEYIKFEKQPHNTIAGRPLVRGYDFGNRISVRLKYSSGAQSWHPFSPQDPNLENDILDFLFCPETVRKNELFGKGRKIGVVRENIPSSLTAIFDKAVEKGNQ